MMIQPKKNKIFGPSKQLLRIISGVALGFCIYYLAYHYASVDCETIQNTNRSGGFYSALKIIAVLVTTASLGIPSAISGLVAGLLLGPEVGGPMASLSVVISSAISWAVGRLVRKNKNLKSALEGRLATQDWFNQAMEKRSTTGFQWTIAISMSAPVPYPFFSFVGGALIPHLTFSSMIAGIFMASVLHIAGYALAGGSIGCAVVNHALGLSFAQYKTMMLISCGTLLLLSKLQISISQRGRS